MNLVEDEGAYGYKEEDDEEEEEGQTNVGKLLFSSQFSSSSSSKYPHQNNSWLHQDSQNFDKMDLSLATTTNTAAAATNMVEIDQNYSASMAGGSSSAIEKEHMFDKVVTPSDVGKLNRLVIPKQHAEKYFPLDSSSNEKGLLLNFEDRNGKPWRFRYSYWNSSQSYVMTKGWSRFVKEKKLDAGDIVSFQRGIGESAKNRLFIDWRRRPNMVSDPSSFAHLNHHHHHHQIQHNTSIQFPSSARWTGRLYPLPQPQFQQLHFNSTSSNFHPHHVNQNPYNSSPYYYNLRASQPQVQVPPVQTPLHHHQHLPMVLDSVPVVHGKTVGKRLRLFGVNMECTPIQDEDNESPNSGSSNSVHQLTMQQAEFSKKGKSTDSSPSVSVDLDL